MKKQFFYAACIVASIFLFGCSNPAKRTISFLESDFGLKTTNKLLMKDSKDFKEYVETISKEYDVSKDENRVEITLSSDVKITIIAMKLGDKIIGFDYEFRFSEDPSSRGKMRNEFKIELEKIIEKDFKNDSYISFNVSDRTNNVIASQAKSAIGLSVDYNYRSKVNLMKEKIKLNSVNRKVIYLTYPSGSQIVPDGKIWIPSKMLYCLIEPSINSELPQGELLSCNASTKNDRLMYIDAIINNRCLSFDGDRQLRDFTSDFDSLCDVYNKELKINSVFYINSGELFPGAKIAVNTPNENQFLTLYKVLIIEEFTISENAQLKEYYNYMNSFNVDKNSFDFVKFMSIREFLFDE